MSKRMRTAGILADGVQDGIVVLNLGGTADQSFQTRPMKKWGGSFISLKAKEKTWRTLKI
jgi:hypothetical protein